MREGEKEASQKEIQNFMRISHPTVVNILRLMKEKGFIETSTSHEDKRMKIVRLTGKEDKFVKDVISEREEMEKQLVKGLTQKDQENLRWYLKKMYENLTEAS